MAEQNEGIISKLVKAGEAALDGYLAKAKSDIKKDAAWEKRGIDEIDYGTEQQYGWKERRGLVGPEVMKNMARKDSIMVAIRKTRLAQVGLFTKPQKDKYSPGWIIEPQVPADISEEEKMQLSDPAIMNDDEAFEKLKYELDQKRAKLQREQEEEMKEVVKFIQHCGLPDNMVSGKRLDFPTFVSLIVDDRLIYNYSAIEMIPTKGDKDKLSHFYPVSAGGIRFVTEKSSIAYKNFLKNKHEDGAEKYVGADKPFRYAQVVRGRVRAAWTEDEMIFTPAAPTIDPEDIGYAPGELEYLIQIITAHLYAEAHNRNFFTQGVGTKGILHIKGDNINRAQLEAFKRHWFNQVVNSRNAFRPPIIGIADDVKWIELSQSNKDMEFDNWMNYLIKICCAVYQIDPAEINFDISKSGNNALNEGNNESKVKLSKDKGLKPLLDYVENMMNYEILRRWDGELAEKYKFRFVGLDAETREEEYKRLKEETTVWKTINEARVEMGRGNIEHANIIRDANYTQYLAQKEMANAAGEMGAEGEEQPPEDDGIHAEHQDHAAEVDEDHSRMLGELEEAAASAQNELDEEAKAEEQDKKVKEETKKSAAAVVEYYFDDEDTDD